MKYTLDNDSTPTNKSEIQLNPLIWMKYNSKVVISLIASFFVFLYFSYMYSFWFILGALLLLAINLFYWLRVKEHLKAESTPGIVISTDPPLMAVYSNMSKYGEFYPAIKIESFNNIRKLSIGTKIATASIYTEGNKENGYWDEIYPIPVEYGTNRKREIERAISFYTKEQWKLLEIGLAEIKESKKEGLYQIMESESDWKNA